MACGPTGKTGGRRGSAERAGSQRLAPGVAPAHRQPARRVDAERKRRRQGGDEAEEPRCCVLLERVRRLGCRKGDWRALPDLVRYRQRAVRARTLPPAGGSSRGGGSCSERGVYAGASRNSLGGIFSEHPTSSPLSRRPCRRYNPLRSSGEDPFEVGRAVQHFCIEPTRSCPLAHIQGLVFTGGEKPLKPIRPSVCSRRQAALPCAAEGCRAPGRPGPGHGRRGNGWQAFPGSTWSRRRFCAAGRFSGGPGGRVAGPSGGPEIG